MLQMSFFNMLTRSTQTLLEGWAWFLPNFTNFLTRNAKIKCLHLFGMLTKDYLDIMFSNKNIYDMYVCLFLCAVFASKSIHI